MPSALTFDKSKVSYNKWGDVIITDVHHQMLRDALPQLQRALQEKWGEKLRAWLADPQDLQSKLKWHVLDSYREKLIKQIESFLEETFEDGTLHLRGAGLEGQNTSSRARIEKELAPLVAEMLFTLPVTSALKDLVYTATEPGLAPDWSDTYGNQITEARFFLWEHLDETFNKELGALFYLNYASNAEIFFCEPDEYLDAVWDVILDELPDELKALHISVFDQGPTKESRKAPKKAGDPDINQALHILHAAGAPLDALVSFRTGTTLALGVEDLALAEEYARAIVGYYYGGSNLTPARLL